MERVLAKGLEFQLEETRKLQMKPAEAAAVFIQFE